MARRVDIPPVKQKTKNIVYDKEGNQILVLGTDEEYASDQDGSLTVSKVSENLELADGRSFNFAQAYGPKPIHVGICHFCRFPPLSWFGRHKPTHGLVDLAVAKRCAGCGKLMCPRHMKLCSDGKPRCKRCARRQAVKRVLCSIFFTYEEG